MDRLRLRAGAFEVDVVPALGGAVAAFRMRHAGRMRALFRETPNDARDVLQTACFPLAPFANRVRAGRFNFARCSVVLSLPLHGQAWRGIWDVVARDGASATLAFHHARGEWPWSYAARQTIALDRDGLTITLTVANLDSDAMPCGLGLHPYFPKDQETRVTARVGGVWRSDAEQMPVALVPARGAYALDGGRLTGRVLDNCYEGWDGRAAVAWPLRRVVLDISALGATRAQVFAPQGGDFFCFEPVTNAIDAFNRIGGDPARVGVAVLGPGGDVSISVRFRPRGL